MRVLPHISDPRIQHKRQSDYSGQASAERKIQHNRFVSCVDDLLPLPDLLITKNSQAHENLTQREKLQKKQRR